MAGRLDYVFSNLDAGMLACLRSIFASHRHAGTDGLWHRRTAATETKPTTLAEEARGANRSEPNGYRCCRKTAVLLATGGLAALAAVGSSSASPRWMAPGVIPESPQVAPGGSKIREWSEKLGIPQDAIVADYLQKRQQGHC